MTVEASISVPFVDWESPRETFDDDGNFSATRVLRCDWNKRATLMDELRGGWLDVPAGSSGERILPARYPTREKAFVRNVSAKGYPALKGKDATNFPNFDYALIDVGYAENSLNISWEDDDRLVVSNHFEGGVDVLTKQVAENSIFWNDANDAVAVESAPNVVIPVLKWNITILDVLTLNVPMISMMGAVNENVIDERFYPRGVRGVWEFAAETLRYETPDMQETLDQDGNVRWHVTLQFTHIVPQEAYPTGTSTWNHAFKPGRNKPEKMWTHATNRTDPGDRYFIYRKAELNDLLGEFLD